MKKPLPPAAGPQPVVAGLTAEKGTRTMAHYYLPPPATLARAVANTLVIASDPQAEHASIFYWAHGRRYALAVVEAMRHLEDMPVCKVAERLMQNPADPDIYFDLIGQLVELHRTPSSTRLDALFTAT